MSLWDRARFFARPLYKRLFPHTWAVRSFSQEGEDILIEGLFSDLAQGCYVDVGCHHPYRFSNTYRLYRKGWSGLCIDPLPGTCEAFTRSRPRDTVVEVGVSLEPGELEYFMFNEPALNTFDEELAQEQAQRDGYHVERRILCVTRPLRQLLSESGLGRVDFLTIDVEGMDLEVLQSNDWQRWRPRVVLVECLAASLDEIGRDPVYRFMRGIGYSAMHKPGRSIIYVDGKTS